MGWECHIYRKLRYSSNPNCINPLLYQSQILHLCSSPKTLNFSGDSCSCESCVRSNCSRKFDADGSDYFSRILCRKDPNLNRSSSISSLNLTFLLYLRPENGVCSRNANSGISGRYFVSKLADLGPVSSASRSFSTSSIGVSPSQEPLESSISSETHSLAECWIGARGKSQVSRKNFDRQTSRGNVKRQPTRWKPSQEVIEIVELVKRGEDHMKSKLSQRSGKISPTLLCEVLEVLNSNRVPALHFFNWVRDAQPEMNCNSQIWSLIISNLGGLKNYDSMLLLLKVLSEKRICLTERAFGFLPVFRKDRASVRSSVKRVIDILTEVGGSCCRSGTYALIKKLCTSNAFDMATFVMEETAKKTSYYNIMIWAKCRSGNFQAALDILDQIRNFGCDPNANSYNYLLGGLCKNGSIVEACNLLNAMEESGYIRDPVTFEVLVYHACRLQRLDFAIEFLNQMMLCGLEPRLTTHAAFIKGYFNDERFQEAHRYVVDMSNRYKSSANESYSLLASLHQQKGYVVEAREILVEMIEKGLKPNFPIFKKVKKDLSKLRMADLAADLESRFSKFQSRTKTG
ncbi:pentatricopeptide repeat-containing protein At3g14580, mitochondrial-like [Macadamia integrifolia]|uniref:pentatricopeptide repeat-containing protein At3g14580, mitochondrial-like n=1 Tax=Macadamia integrifolia TaxID=60698 RepID=UPI001C4FE6EE|nr:pentatricopeptide repeat-containing protein At3g14580, mitochondrial-like [Macadamia integrifolia]